MLTSLIHQLLLLANIYFGCLIWAKPWVFVLLFVVVVPDDRPSDTGAL